MHASIEKTMVFFWLVQIYALVSKTCHDHPRFEYKTFYISVTKEVRVYSVLPYMMRNLQKFVGSTVYFAQVAPRSHHQLLQMTFSNTGREES